MVPLADGYIDVWKMDTFSAVVIVGISNCMQEVINSSSVINIIGDPATL